MRTTFPTQDNDMVMTQDRNVTTYTTPVATEPVSSLTALIAGVAVALILQLALNLLGVALGASSINPLSQQDPIEARLGIAAVLWIVVSALISLFTGGYVAARMAGNINKDQGVLHGLATWAIATIISVVLLTSGVGNVLGTASNVLGQGLNLAGGAVSELSPLVADSLNLQDIRLDGITEQALGFLTPATDTTGATTGDTTTGAMTPATDAEPTAIQRELTFAVTRLLTAPTGSTDGTSNRQNVVDLLVAQGNVTQADAEATVAQWESDFQQVRADAEATAREVGETVANTVAALAGVVFMMMVVGAVAAGFGGYSGTDNTPFITTRRVVTSPSGAKLDTQRTS